MTDQQQTQGQQKPDQHHPEPNPSHAPAESPDAPQPNVRLEIAEPENLTRGDRARIAAHIIEDLRRLTADDPAFDLARQHMREARDVLPTKAE